MEEKVETQKFTLRPYQKEAIAAVREARGRGLKRMLVCLPTGAGKTVIFSHIVKDTTKGVLVIAHREELLTQAKDKLERALEGKARVDIEQGDRRASPDARVVVCSIRSLRTERLERLLEGREIELVIYDECHHATADDNMRVLRELGAFDPHWSGALLGFTATTKRGDGMGLEKAFEEIVYDRSILQMVEDGYLTPLRGFRVATSADLTQIGGGGKDFNVEELAEAIDIEERNALVARAIQELARDRKILVFCVTVLHAKNLARALRYLGIPTSTVHGAMKREDRVEVLGALREGRIQALTNVGVLTEGFDDPSISCVAMARPTKSQALYVQCVGRGMRLHPDKEDCLVLDFVDLSNLSLVTLPSLFGMPRGIDLQGQTVEEGREFFRKMFFDYPGFEIEANGITLDEIQRRAESFNPLTLELHPEIRAISGNAWISLGSAGLVLHFHKNKKKLSEFLILDSQQRGKKRYQVYLDQDNKASFSEMEDAVQAVDYEIYQMGPLSQESASPDAAWRGRPTPKGLQQKLLGLKPPRHARTTGEAMRILAFSTYARKRRWGR